MTAANNNFQLKQRHVFTGGLAAAVAALLLALGITATPAAAADGPPPPVNLAQSPGPAIGQVRLTWTVPQDGVRRTGFVIEESVRQGSAATPFVEVARTTRARATLACTAELTGPNPGTCAYRVRSLYRDAVGEPSEEVVVQWAAPGPVRLLTLTPWSYIDVQVAWAPPTSTGGLPVTYTVEVSNDLQATWTVIGSGIIESPFPAIGWCTNPKRCSYRVTAVNAAGASPARVATLSFSPTQVIGLTATVLMVDPTPGDPTSSGQLFVSWATERAGTYDHEIQLCSGACTATSGTWGETIRIVGMPQAIESADCEIGLATCTVRVRATNGVRTGPWAYVTVGPVRTEPS